MILNLNDNKKTLIFAIACFFLVILLNLIQLKNIYATDLVESPTSFEDAISQTFSDDSYFYAFKGYDGNFYVIQTKSSGVHWDGYVTETSQLKYENTPDSHSYNIFKYINNDLTVVYSHVDNVVNELVTVYLDDNTPIGYGGLRPSSSLYVSPAMAKLEGETELYHGVKVFQEPSKERRLLGGITAKTITALVLNWTDYLVPLVLGLVVLVIAFRKGWKMLKTVLVGA